MGALLFPTARERKITRQGGSRRVTIPPGVCEALDIEDGQPVAEVKYDPDEQSVTFYLGDG